MPVLVKTKGAGKPTTVTASLPATITFLPPATSLLIDNTSGSSVQVRFNGEGDWKTLDAGATLSIDATISKLELQGSGNVEIIAVV